MVPMTTLARPTTPQGPQTQQQTQQPDPRDLGVNFPVLGSSRSSTLAAKLVLSEALQGVDDGTASRVAELPGWRTAYPQAYVDLTRVEASSPSAATGIARTGLAAARSLFVHATAEGDRPLGEALLDGPELGTAVVRGTARPAPRLEVPYEGALLHGDALLRQLDRWVARGITEPDFADAVGAVVRNPDWVDLRDRTVALVGAGAAMGPFAQLVEFGATVAAVDLPRPAVWARLAATTQRSAGTMLVPTRGEGVPVDTAGANLLTEVGAVERWLRSVPGPVTLGNYGYADGALFVRLSMAFELLVHELAQRRDDLSLAYLATPSDAFLVPESAALEARRRRRSLRPAVLAGRAIHAATRGERFQGNDQVLETEHGRYGLVDAFIVEQGPNYAFAKRLQRWRMVLARAEGTLTSVHVAPPTRTASVHKNPAMAQRQRLTGRLGMEAFDADTSQALGAAILVHDLRNPASPANPAMPMTHPHEAFMFAANPGGRWRAPFTPASALPVMERLDRWGLVRG